MYHGREKNNSQGRQRNDARAVRNSAVLCSVNLPSSGGTVTDPSRKVLEIPSISSFPLVRSINHLSHVVRACL